MSETETKREDACDVVVVALEVVVACPVVDPPVEVALLVVVEVVAVAWPVVDSPVEVALLVVVEVAVVVIVVGRMHEKDTEPVKSKSQSSMKDSRQL